MWNDSFSIGGTQPVILGYSDYNDTRSYYASDGSIYVVASRTWEDDYLASLGTNSRLDLKLDPTLSYIFQRPDASVTDYLGGAAAAYDYHMNNVLLRSNSAAAAVVPQVAATFTAAEAQFMKHVMAAPSIVSMGISLAQVYDAFKRGDSEGVYTNAANAFGGLAGAEIVAVIASYGYLGGGLMPVAAVGIGAVVGGLVAAGAAKITYDYINGRIDEHYADRLLLELRQSAESFYQYYPFARRQQ